MIYRSVQDQAVPNHIWDLQKLTFRLNPLQLVAMRGIFVRPFIAVRSFISKTFNQEARRASKICLFFCVEKLHFNFESVNCILS